MKKCNNLKYVKKNLKNEGKKKLSFPNLSLFILSLLIVKQLINPNNPSHGVKTEFFHFTSYV